MITNCAAAEQRFLQRFASVRKRLAVAMQATGIVMEYRAQAFVKVPVRN